MKSNKLSVISLVLPVLIMYALPLHAEQGDWLVRARGIVVHPNDSSGLISLGGVPVTNTGVEVDTNAVPELDVTYMLWTHWGIEVIAGVTQHDVDSEGTGLGLPDGFKLFDSWVLPPTVTLQYHFLPDNKIRPYVDLASITRHFSETMPPHPWKPSPVQPMWTWITCGAGRHRPA